MESKVIEKKSELITIRVGYRLWSLLMEKAKREECSVSQVIRVLIEEKLKE